MTPGPGPEERHGPLFWASVVLGWAAIGVGAWVALLDPGATRPGWLAAYVLGAALVHDLVVAPAVLLAGVGLARAVGGPIRAWVQGAVAASALVVVATLPVVLAPGRQPDNPSLLPRDYGFGVLVVVGAVWAGTLGLFLVARARRGRAAGDDVGARA